MRSIRSAAPVQGRGRRASLLSSLSSGSVSRKRRDLAIAAATRSAGALAEALESRLLMAAHTWLGPVNLLWSESGNWIGGAPGANEAHVALIFPATGIQKSLIDDIPTLNQVDSITFTGTGYNIDGSSSTIHLNALGATYNIDDQAGGNTLGNNGLTIAMVPQEFVRVSAGRLNLNALLA